MGDQRLEDLADGHLALADSDLALLHLHVCEVFHMHVEEPRADRVDSLHNIRTGARGVAYVDATTDARVHVLHQLEYVERRLPELVFWPVVMDGNLYVVLLHELFDAREACRRWITRNDDPDARPFAVLKLATDIVIVIPWEVDGTRRVKLDAGGGVIGQGLRLLRGIRGQMIPHVLCIQVGDIELLQIADHLSPGEFAKRIAGNGRV